MLLKWCVSSMNNWNFIPMVLISWAANLFLSKLCLSFLLSTSNLRVVYMVVWGVPMETPTSWLFSSVPKIMLEAGRWGRVLLGGPMHTHFTMMLILVDL